MYEGKGTDFVLLCEFSEKDGPVPRELLGTPSGAFPLDQFAVKLMSVEMKIEVGEKWSAWCEWKAQGVEYLVVHFQLHDLDARGYSRQLVFAYVSYHPKKLIKHRNIYLDALNYAADMMMEANEMDWKFELHKRIQDLKKVYLYIKMDQFQQIHTLSPPQSENPVEPPSNFTTQSQTSKQARPKLSKPNAIKTFESSEDLPFPSPSTLETTYMELKKLQSQIKGGGRIFKTGSRKKTRRASSNLDADKPSSSFDAFYRQKISQHNKALDESLGLQKPQVTRKAESLPSVEASKGEMKSNKDHKRNLLRDLYEPWKLKMKKNLKNGEAVFSIVEPSQAQLGHVYSLHYKNTLYDKSLRSIWQLCPPALTRSLSLLRGLLDGFSHSSIVLDHILTEHKQLLRSPSSLLAIGEVPIVNFDLDAINASTPTPSSLRWLAQSKVQAPISLASLELGGLDAIHMSNGPRKHSTRFSFASLPSYLSSTRPNHPSSVFAAQTSSIATPTLLSPVNAPNSFSSLSSFDSTSTMAPPTPMNSNRNMQHPLGLLAASVGLSRLGMRNESIAASSPTSGASYISPGAPLISELAMATSNAYLTHRLDYLAADLTSISTLLWPSSTCPSAYFPAQGTGASFGVRSSPNATGLAYDPTFSKNIGLAASNGSLVADPAVANYDFSSFLGLGTAASSAALASGALSLSLTMSPTALPGSSSASSPAPYASHPSQMNPIAKAEYMRMYRMRYVPNTAPTTFTSCIACKHAAVDSLLVQLQHDAICIKSGEDEATHIWNVKWRDLTTPPSPSPSRTTSSHSSSDFKSSHTALNEAKSQEMQKMTDSKTDSIAASEYLQPHSDASKPAQEDSKTQNTGQNNPNAETTAETITSNSNASPAVISTTIALASPEPIHTTVPKVLEPSRSPSPSVTTRNQGNTASLPVSAATSPAPVVQPPHSTTSSPAPNTKKSSAQSSSTSSGNRKSSSFASILSGGSSSTSKDASSQSASNVPVPVPVSEMNLLHLRNRFSFLRHVIFSLLKGRPVVIHAEARNRPWVEQVVSSLACFVPGHHLSGDSVSQTLFQLDPSTSKSSTTPQYIPRQAQSAKIIHWRDARDVIFESIHNQSPTGSSTKSRLKHTKLVITRFLQLHLQKMQSYSTFAKQDTTQSNPSASTSPTSTTVPERNPLLTASTSGLSSMSDTSSMTGNTRNSSSRPSNSNSNASCSFPASHGSSSQLNIPTLATASRQAIKLSQLSHLKLIGLDKSCPVPKTVERYVTYWDWEAEELTCVAYEKGKLLDAMINPKKQWPDEASYRAHIHFHLSDLATRAWMYYHMCCIGLFLGGIGNSNSLAVSHLPVPSPMVHPYSSQSSNPAQSGYVSHSNQSAHTGATGPSQSYFGQNASQLSPITPKKTSAASHTGNTSPNAVANELGFEPSAALRNPVSGPSGATTTTHPPKTPSSHPSNAKSAQNSTALMGPSLSNSISFDPSSSTISLPPTPNLARESSFGSLSAASPYKGGTPAAGKSGRNSRTSSASHTDPRGTSSIYQASSSSASSSGNGQTPITPPTAADYAFQAQLLQQRTKTAYFQSLKLAEHDCDIIEYLAELIKMQQAAEVKSQMPTFQPFSSLQVNDLIALSIHNKFGDAYANAVAGPNAHPPNPLSGIASQTIKLDYAATRKFKNMQLN